jgi:hypothetical protein
MTVSLFAWRGKRLSGGFPAVVRLHSSPRKVLSIMTLFGNHTLAETLDLVKAKNYEIDKVNETVAGNGGKPPPDADWNQDWTTLQGRYKEAISKVPSSPPFGISPNAYTTEDEYQGILRALQQVDGEVSKGDLQDIWNRLTGEVGPVEETVPQPTAPDSDLQAYKAADKAVKTVEAAQSSITHSPLFWAAIAAAGVVGVFMVTQEIKTIKELV